MNLLPNVESKTSLMSSPLVRVPLLDLKEQYATIRQEIEEAVKSVFESQHFILGPEVERCESLVCDYVKARFAVGVSSGTDALLMALMGENIQPGDEVITTPYSFFATVGAIVRLGAVPVFVDIDPVTFNLNPAKLEAVISKKTKAIIPVHLYGQAADMKTVMEIASKHGLIVIEDAAQAMGAEYWGQRVGSIGHYGCFSFFPSKNLGGAGDGGMITTQDEVRAERLRKIRNHGSYPKYFHAMVGGNFRLDAIQAAVINVKLPHLDQWSLKRLQNAQTYIQGFRSAGLEKFGLQAPELGSNRHVVNQFVIRLSRRDALREFLKQRGVETEIYYPLPLHLQECFSYLGYQEGSFPESEKAAKESLALPIFPELSKTQLEWVIQSIRDFYRAEK